MKKIVKRAGLISGIILSAFVIGGCGKTVDLNDCVEVKVSGIVGKCGRWIIEDRSGRKLC